MPTRFRRLCPASAAAARWGGTGDFEGNPMSDINIDAAKLPKRGYLNHPQTLAAGFL